MKVALCGQIFEKYSNSKFHETPPIGSRAVPRGRSEERRDMTKQTAAFHNFANAPKTRVFSRIATSRSKSDILTEMFSTSANGQATKKTSFPLWLTNLS